MKKFVALLSAILLVLPSIASMSVSPVNNNGQNTSVSDRYVGITYDDVYNYLVSNGYIVMSLRQLPGTLNWQAHTLKGRSGNYMTTVYTNGSYILGHEDFPIY